jgi:DNA-binding NtrC family response regulator
MHVVERAAVLCGGEVIDLPNLPEPLRGAAAPASPAVVVVGGGGDADLSLHAAVARVEKELVLRALERAGGNRSAAARLLGIGRAQLYAKMDEHGIGPRAEPEDAG